MRCVRSNSQPCNGYSTKPVRGSCGNTNRRMPQPTVTTAVRDMAFASSLIANAPAWIMRPPNERSMTTTKPKPANGRGEKMIAPFGWRQDNITTKNIHSWDDPDISLLDDRRGELPEFPIEALNPALAAGLGQTCRTQGPVRPWITVAVPLLGIASGLIGTSRRVKASRSWTEPLTLWTCLVGYSGDGKTPGIKAIKGPLDEVEEAHKEDMSELKGANMRCASRPRKLRKPDRKAAFDEATERHKPNPPPKPAEADEPPAFNLVPAPLCCRHHHRTHGLAAAGMRPQGMLLIADELAGWFLNMSRYSGGTDNQFWLMAWDGHSHVTERVGRPPIELEHLLVGIAGGLQPDKIAECFKGAADGMYARFLLTWPDKAPYRPLTDEVEEVDRDMVAMFDRLAYLEEHEHRLVPFCLTTRGRCSSDCVREPTPRPKRCLGGNASGGRSSYRTSFGWPGGLVLYRMGSGPRQ